MMRAVQLRQFGGPEVLLAVTGALKIVIGGSYPLEQALTAHQALETRATHGKLALIP